MKKAFTLLEGLAAAGVLLLALRFSLVPLLQASRGSNSSLQRLRAQAIARDWIQRDGFAQAVESQASQDGFSIQRQVTASGPRLKSVLLQVAWEEGQQVRRLTLETQVFEEREMP